MKGTVTRDREMKRILALEKKEADIEYPDYTNEYRVEGGTWQLNDYQNKFIYDLKHNNGPFADIPVGGGKSLASLIAGTVLKAKRPLLLVPAPLREQTNKYVIPEQEKQFNITSNVKVMSYTELSLAKNQDFMNTFKPDLIVCDEAHKLKDVKTARVKRFKRYLQKNKNVRVVLMSGSFYKAGIKDMAHLSDWTHGDQSPLPRTWRTMDLWSAAVDSGLPWNLQAKPGALRYLAEDPIREDEIKMMPVEAQRKACRQLIHKRIYSTPGFISPTEATLGIGLEVYELKAPKMTKPIKEAIKKLEEEWISPAGKQILLATELASLKKQLIQGYYTYWEEEAPEIWMEARREFNNMCNRITKGSHTVDSELLFKRQYSGHPTVLHWENQKAMFRPKVLVKWICNSHIKLAGKWAKKNKKGGIIWVSNPRMGHKIEEELGIKYFGAGSGAEILEHKGMCCASVRSYGTGYNLQHYNKALWMMPLRQGDDIEQLIGRHYRRGQLADTVEVHIICRGHEILESIYESSKKNIQVLNDLKGQRQLYQIATKIKA